jgi:microcystin-dependent protein
MSDQFVAEIRIFPFNFPPTGWAFCDGQIMPISQNTALFSLLGTTYGGDGRVNFALPNLRGRTPIHFGVNHTLGERGGEVAHTLTAGELPTHVHTLGAIAADGTQVIPTGDLLARAAPANPYRPPTSLAAMNTATVGTTGGSQPHQNMQPYLTLSLCIALQGIFPSQN